MIISNLNIPPEGNFLQSEKVLKPPIITQSSDKNLPTQSRFLSACPIPNCQECLNTICNICSPGFTIEGNTCTSSQDSSKDNSVILILMILGSSIFLIGFCFVCLYIARKNRHRYVEHPVSGRGTKCNSMKSEEEVEVMQTYRRNTAITNNINVTEFGAIRDQGEEEEERKKLDSIKQKRCTDRFLCSVCFSDKLELVEARDRGCHHRIHFSCVVEMVSSNINQCPVCGKKLII